MSAPRVSAIIPTYNRARTLPRAVRSVLAQSFTELELLVVDDGSTDETESLVRSFGDSRIRYIRQANGGVAAARNAGAAAARGEFIAFLDSDDEWLLSKLEKQVAALDAAGPEVGLALCGLLRFDTLQAHYLPNPSMRGARQPDIHAEILKVNYAQTSGWCVRRVHFQQIGPFDESLPPLEDWEWMIRYTARFHSVLVDEPLCVVHESPDSISSNQQKYIRALRGIIEKHQATLAQTLPASLAGLHYSLGKKYSLYDDAAEGRRCYLRAIRIYPRDWRFWAALALSFVGAPFFRSVWRSVRRLKGYRVRPT